MTYVQKLTQKINQIGRLAILVLMVTFGLLTNFPANAQALNGTALKELALQGTWQAQHDVGGYWNWKEDNLVCVRMFEKDDNCADTGTWAIKDNVICYEFTWWGKAAGVRKNCITVNALGDERYEAIHHGGAMDSLFFKFTVLE